MPRHATHAQAVLNGVELPARITDLDTCDASVCALDSRDVVAGGLDRKRTGLADVELRTSAWFSKVKDATPISGQKGRLVPERDGRRPRTEITSRMVVVVSGKR